MPNYRNDVGIFVGTVQESRENENCCMCEADGKWRIESF